jgi:hypothetical protein
VWLPETKTEDERRKTMSRYGCSRRGYLARVTGPHRGFGTVQRKGRHQSQAVTAWETFCSCSRWHAWLQIEALLSTLLSFPLFLMGRPSFNSSIPPRTQDSHPHSIIPVRVAQSSRSPAPSQPRCHSRVQEGRTCPDRLADISSTVVSNLLVAPVLGVI